MDLLLDVNIVVDICALREKLSAIAAQAVEHCILSGAKVWLYAGSVQTYDYNLRNELRRAYLSKGRQLSNAQCAGLSKATLIEFSKDKNWLAALSAEGHVFEAQDPEDEQLIRALDRLIPGEIALLTRDEQLLNRQDPRILSPEQYLTRRLEARPIDFIDLKGQQNDIRPTLETCIHRVLHHGQYI